MLAEEDNQGELGDNLDEFEYKDSSEEYDDVIQMEFDNDETPVDFAEST